MLKADISATVELLARHARQCSNNTVSNGVMADARRHGGSRLCRLGLGCLLC